MIGQSTEADEEEKEHRRSSSSSSSINAAAVYGEQGGSSNDTLLRLIQSIQRQQQEQAEQNRQWQREQAAQARQWQQTLAEQSQQIADMKMGRATAGTQAHSAANSPARNGTHNRPSMGYPTSAFESPVIAAAAARRADAVDEHDDEYAAADHTEASGAQRAGCVAP